MGKFGEVGLGGGGRGRRGGGGGGGSFLDDTHFLLTTGRQAFGAKLLMAKLHGIWEKNTPNSNLTVAAKAN